MYGIAPWSTAVCQVVAADVALSATISFMLNPAFAVCSMMFIVQRERGYLDPPGVLYLANRASAFLSGFLLAHDSPFMVDALTVLASSVLHYLNEIL